MKNELTQEMKDAVDDMVNRRMENTGETRQESAAFIAKYLRDRADWIRANSK